MLRSVLAACGTTVNFAQPNSHLERVNPPIAGAEAGVGNVHVAQFHAPIAVIPEEVCPQRDAGCEVDARSSGWHVMIGEQRPATQLEVRDNVSTSGEIPFQIHWINSGSEGSVGWLEDKE